MAKSSRYKTKPKVCHNCGKNERLPNKLRCQQCVDKKRLNDKLLRYNRREAGLCTSCGNDVKGNTSTCQECRSKSINNAKKYKIRAMQAYGGVCQCCGESELAFLTLDHVDNSGGTHRKELGRRHIPYHWFCTNDYPPGFQVLCFNCNSGRHVNGGTCPHKACQIEDYCSPAYISSC